MDYKRILNIFGLLEKKSFFLFGPRGTGKSRLIKDSLPSVPVYDLLHAPTFDRLSRRPSLIGEEQQATQLIVIDEIQKLPRILDEVHRLIESHGTRFLLTGSSARKLRRGGANLLAGRAREASLFPLTWYEMPNFDLLRHLTIGGLPGITLSDEPWEDLRAYTGAYLREEIQAEAIVRRFEPFIRFLDLIASKVGEEINLEALGSDCGVSGKTIRSYLEILDDTLIGFLLRPYRKTKLRKAIARAKFYLFDLGVTNSLLQRRELSIATDAFGRAFEHFLILELRAYLSYKRRFEELYFWRSESGLEVDVIIANKVAIEIKSTDLVHERHLKGLHALREEGLIEKFLVISRDPEPRMLNGIQILPWHEFLNMLWADKIVAESS